MNVATGLGTDNSMTKPLPPKHLLRRLLRRLKTPKLSPTLQRKQGKNKETHQRWNAVQSFVLKQKGNQALGEEFLRLHEDLAERERLYKLDSGAEQVLTPKEQSRRAAARAGLQLPKVDADALNGTIDPVIEK